MDAPGTGVRLTVQAPFGEAPANAEPTATSVGEVSPGSMVSMNTKTSAPNSSVVPLIDDGMLLMSLTRDGIDVVMDTVGSCVSSSNVVSANGDLLPAASSALAETS